jgi:hypothetical protein
MTKWEAFCRQVSVTDKDLGDKSSFIAIREWQICKQSEKFRQRIRLYPQPKTM